MPPAWDKTFLGAGHDVPPAGMEKPPESAIKLSAVETRLAGDLAQYYALLGAGMYLADQYDGTIVIMGSADRARELVLASRHNEKLRKALILITRQGAWLMLAMGHATMTIPILIHHRVLPARVAVAVGMNPASIPLVPPPAARSSSTSRSRPPYGSVPVPPEPARPAETSIPIMPAETPMGYNDNTPAHNPAVNLTERRE